MTVPLITFQVDFEELEMVVIGLDPTHSLTHENIEYLWQVCTCSIPKGKCLGGEHKKLHRT